MDDSGPSPRVTRLTGRGVPGLENDPPLFHVDVEADEIARVSADPGAFLRELGWGHEHGIDVGSMSLTLSRPRNAWSDERQAWVAARPSHLEADAVVWCC